MPAIGSEPLAGEDRGGDVAAVFQSKTNSISETLARFVYSQPPRAAECQLSGSRLWRADDAVGSEAAVARRTSPHLIPGSEKPPMQPVKTTVQSY
jgi:hypothetical protein